MGTAMFLMLMHGESKILHTVCASIIKAWSMKALDGSNYFTNLSF
jgi:hypothetical protein